MFKNAFVFAPIVRRELNRCDREEKRTWPGRLIKSGALERPENFAIGSSFPSLCRDNNTRPVPNGIFNPASVL